MEPFKSLLNPALVRAAGAHLHAAWPAFDRSAFVRRASRGLEALELKARAMQIADALEATLPDRFGAACDVIEAALAPAVEPGAMPPAPEAGLRGWIVWPLGEFVARRGRAEPERALAALHALTQRSSAEFAIRPFIVEHPDLAFATLRRWTGDPSAHVRRLASEGSRPRLPWGVRLKALVADPAPTLPLLAALQDDPSEYVRRSVANHLNDIAKDHPALVVGWVREHLPEASRERRSLLKHASRSLIKQGDAQMLALWGASSPFEGSVTLSLSPRRLGVGDSVVLSLRLRSRSALAQDLLIDYAVHHVKANGSTSAKVFKGWSLKLAPGEARTLAKQHSMRTVTTRRYHAGRHLVDVRINGQAVAQAAFSLAID
ncbi:MAG: DNA alkylation repair protein [Pseudomonadota bacterium]